MSYSALENTPILVNLLEVAIDTGWSVDDDTGIATHVSCNDGDIRLISYTIIDTNTYQVSYAVLTISGGFVVLFAGITQGIQRTVPGFYVETIVAAGTGLYFYSDANCTIQAFNIRNTIEDNSNFQKNTIVYSEKNKKWGEFRTIAPDYGFSIFIDMLTLYLGKLYRHENGSDDRNNFYGTQYQSVLQFVENKAPEIIKSYNSIVLQSNQLMVTTAEGIQTSLGQLSELIDVDFLKTYLNDGVTSANIYSVEGTYSANFLCDINSDGGLINGDNLSGNYIMIELITTNGNAPLQLFSIATNASRKFIGTR